MNNNRKYYIYFIALNYNDKLKQQKTILMKKNLLFIVFLFLVNNIIAQDNHKAEINNTLDAWHKAAAEANAEFVKSLGGQGVKTSYNAKIRKNFAGIGFTYDAVRDAFIPAKRNCHSEEVLEESTCRWECSNVEHKAETI